MKEATKSLLFNGSGYYDNTAYQAIMNVSKEVERMGMRSDYQDGDIVEVTKQNGVTEEFLLLRCHEGYATAAILKERAPAENSVAVISRQGIFIVNVPHNIVVTTMTEDDMKNKTLTNIDSAVFL